MGVTTASAPALTTPQLNTHHCYVTNILPTPYRSPSHLLQTAHQPLKVQLKRKHWAGEGAEAATASKRCTAIFERQVGRGGCCLCLRAEGLVWWVEHVACFSLRAFRSQHSTIDAPVQGSRLACNQLGVSFVVRL